MRFLITGGIAALANFFSRILLARFMSYEWAVALSYLVGMTVGFGLAKIFVFEPSGRKASHEYTRFAVVNIVALTQVWIISVGLARIVFPGLDFSWQAENVAHVIGLSSTAFTSYWGHKHFSFRAHDA